jgi:hypothetical protein
MLRRFGSLYVFLDDLDEISLIIRLPTLGLPLWSVFDCYPAKLMMLINHIQMLAAGLSVTIRVILWLGFPFAG